MTETKADLLPSLVPNPITYFADEDHETTVQYTIWTSERNELWESNEYSIPEDFRDKQDIDNAFTSLWKHIQPTYGVCYVETKNKEKELDEEENER